MNLLRFHRRLGTRGVSLIEPDGVPTYDIINPKITWLWGMAFDVRIPGVKVVSGIEQGGDNGTDGDVKIASLGFIKPYRDLDRTDRGLNIQRLFEHGLYGHRPQF